MKVYPVSPKSKAELEILGEQILMEFDPQMLMTPKALCVESLIDCYMSRKFGWDLDIREDLPGGILGLSDPKNKTVGLPEETYSGIINGEGRPRFTGCHEFSHVVLHKDQMQFRMITLDPYADKMYRTERSNLKSYNDPEWQADYLAGVLLMPKRMVLQLMRQYSGENLISAMASIFKVSRQAAEVRIRKI